MNNIAYNILIVLCGDATTGDYLFLNRDGKQQESFKKGFAAACERAALEDLRPYDLRATFATKLVERGVHQYIISALMGHAMPGEGFGHESRITPGYAQATWESMVRAVESLEYPASEITVFGRQTGKNQEKSDENDATQEKVKAG